MQISMYDFLVLFVLVPVLLFRFTDIPRWLFRRLRRLSPRALLLALAAALLLFAVLFATCSDSVWTVRIGAFAVGAMACALHYCYTESRARDRGDGQD